MLAYLIRRRGEVVTRAEILLLVLVVFVAIATRRSRVERPIVPPVPA